GRGAVARQQPGLLEERPVVRRAGEGGGGGDAGDRLHVAREAHERDRVPVEGLPDEIERGHRPQDFGGVMPYVLILRYRCERSMPSRSAVRVMFQSLARSSARIYARSKPSRASFNERWPSAAAASLRRSGAGRSSGPMTSPVVMITRRSTILRSSRTFPGHSYARK